MAKNVKKLTIILLILLNKINIMAQNGSTLPVKSIHFEHKLIYSDSIILSKKLSINYCDSVGNILTNYTNYFLLKYRGYSFIYYEGNETNAFYHKGNCNLVIRLRRIKRILRNGISIRSGLLQLNAENPCNIWLHSYIINKKEKIKTVTP